MLQKLFCRSLGSNPYFLQKIVALNWRYKPLGKSDLALLFSVFEQGLDLIWLMRKNVNFLNWIFPPIDIASILQITSWCEKRFARNFNVIEVSHVHVRSRLIWFERRGGGRGGRRKKKGKKRKTLLFHKKKKIKD